MTTWVSSFSHGFLKTGVELLFTASTVLELELVIKESKYIVRGLEARVKE